MDHGGIEYPHSMELHTPAYYLDHFIDTLYNAIKYALHSSVGSISNVRQIFYKLYEAALYQDCL